MDTITILGTSLLFFYSLATILQFYGIDTSIYLIYILFYVFIIISGFILPTTYAKLFPSPPPSVENDLFPPRIVPIADGKAMDASPVVGSPVVGSPVVGSPVVGTYTNSPVVGTYTNSPVVERDNAGSPSSPAHTSENNPRPKDKITNSAGFFQGLSSFAQALPSLVGALSNLTL